MFILIIFMMLFLLLLPFIILGIVVLDYLIESFALWRIAKQTDACKPVYAWIPVVQYWVMGKCAEACQAQDAAMQDQKPWKWGKLLLIFGLVQLGAVLVVLPIGMLLALFGFSFLVTLVSWTGVALTVVNAICAYKIFHYYLKDPSDILVLVLTVLYPAYATFALLIVSFFKPQKQNAVKAVPFTEGDAPAVIPAEQVSAEQVSAEQISAEQSEQG